MDGRVDTEGNAKQQREQSRCQDQLNSSGQTFRDQIGNRALHAIGDAEVASQSVADEPDELDRSWIIEAEAGPARPAGPQRRPPGRPDY